MTSRMKPMFRYQFSSLLKSAGIFFVVMLLVLAATCALTLTSRNGSVEIVGSFAGYSFAAAITVFVFGICTIREDLRLGVQLGASRKTVFLSELLAIVAVCFLLSVAGELLILGGAAVMQGTGFVVSDLYQLAYFDGQTLSGAEWLIGVLMNALAYLCAFVSGQFLSLLFYRLPKPWVIVVAVGLPLLLTVGLPVLSEFTFFGRFLQTLLVPLIRFAIQGPLQLILCFAAYTAVALLVNWLLTRRAPIRAAK